MLPNLQDRIRSLQESLKPDDPQFGNGISDWTITSEYRPNLEVDGEAVWGCMCSPSRLPALECLTPEDIAEKRAHIIIRTATIAAELPEIDRTLFHEMGHVLAAGMRSTDREAEENMMHSLDAFYAKKLSSEQAHTVARAMQNPRARAYRAPNGGTMPGADDDKKPDKKSPAKQEPGGVTDDKKTEGEPKKQEGAPRDVATIEQELLAARLANDAAKMAALQDEWFAAKMASSTTAVETQTAPPPVPEMGMKPEEAAAYRKKADDAIKASQNEAIEAIIEANPHLGDPQKAMVRKQASAKAARELVATYARPEEPARPTLGMKGHPSTPAGGGKPQSPLARAVSDAKGDPLFRKAMGIGAADNDGVSYDTPGHIIYIDGSERLRHLRDAYRNRRAAQ